MELYVGMDVSLKETAICVVDDDGKIVCEGTVISQPEALAAFIKTNAVKAKRIGLETGRVLGFGKTNAVKAKRIGPGDLYRCTPRQGGAVDAD